MHFIKRLSKCPEPPERRGGDEEQGGEGGDHQRGEGEGRESGGAAEHGPASGAQHQTQDGL